MKICNKCGVEKELDQFRVWKGYVRGECKSCACVENRKRDPLILAAASRKWSREHPEQRNATKRAWCKKNPDKHNASRRKTTYGLLETQYQDMIVSQDNKCAVCSMPFEKISRVNTPHVDHCHITGKVRGLLCGNCNSGIGKLKDTFSILIRAADYIRKNS